MIRKILGTLALLTILAQGQTQCRADLFVSTEDGILRFDRDGNSSVFADSGGRGGLALDANGDLFVARGQNILKYSTQTGQLLDTFRPSAGFTSPSDLVFGPDGNLYVGVGRDLRRISPTGENEVTLFHNPANNSVEGLAFDAAGNLFASLGNELLVKLSSDGEVLESATIPGSVFSGSDVDLGPSGHLFVTSSTRLREFSANPSHLGVFASPGGVLNGLAFDGDTLYVASGRNIYRVSGDGQTIDNFATGLNNATYIAISPAAVPEPSSVIMLTTGVLGLLGYGWRRRRVALVG